MTRQDFNAMAEMFIIKTWSENALFAPELLEQGWFVDTGRRISQGFVEAQIWKLA